MNVTETLVDILFQEKTEYIFCVPGQHIDPFLESLAGNEKVKTIICAHEAGATYMADGYSRATGRFGICLCIGGPGFTNTLTALATAHTDAVPLLIITGEAKSHLEGKGSFQDSSNAGTRSQNLAAAVTTEQLNISLPSLTYHHMQRLMHTMLSHSSRGPVHLSVPVDIQRAEVSGDWHPISPALYQPRFIDTESCDAFWQKVGSNTKVAILAGSGCVHSGAADELLRFAERYSIPIATTLAAKGVFPEDHPLSLGAMGWCGHRPAIEALTSGSLDVLFVLGSRLNMIATVAWSSGFQPKEALIVNDINSNTLFRNFKIDLPILGDAKTCLAQLNSSPPSQSLQLTNSIESRKSWISQLKNTVARHEDLQNCQSTLIPVHPARTISALREIMPRNTMLFSDSGAHAFFTQHYWTSYEPLKCFSTLKYMGAMGWAISAAIGGKLACPDSPCVVVTGDGCMLMHGIEIQTAARYNIPIICVVINNSALGNPKIRADKVSHDMGQLHALPTHDWANFARSLGAEGLTVNHVEELIPAFEQALTLNKAVVIDVRSGNYPTPTASFDSVVNNKTHTL